MIPRQVRAIADGQTTWRTDRMLLYTAGGLDRDKSHHLELKSIASGRMVIDHAIITDIKSKNGYVLLQNPGQTRGNADATAAEAHWHR